MRSREKMNERMREANDPLPVNVCPFMHFEPAEQQQHHQQQHKEKKEVYHLNPAKECVPSM